MVMGGWSGALSSAMVDSTADSVVTGAVDAAQEGKMFTSSRPVAEGRMFFIGLGTFP